MLDPSERREYVVAIIVAILVVALLYLVSSVASGQSLSDDSVSRIRQHLPRLLDEEFDVALYSPRMIWYDGSRVYQLGFTGQADEEGRTGLVGLADSRLNISGEAPDARRLVGDGNGGNLNAVDPGSWPWMPQPGGTHGSDNVSHVKGLLLPQRDDGSSWPIIVYRNELEGVFAPRPTVTGSDFHLPIGTKVVELITVDDRDRKQHYVCEVRWRIQQAGTVEVEIFRPFSTAASLAEHLATVDDSAAVVLASHCRDNSTVKRRTLRDNHPGNPRFGTRPGSAFSMTAGVDELPPVPADLVRRLLDTKRMEGFASALGDEWKPGCAAPTAIGFHIVPDNYSGGFLGTDAVSCANCHRHALVSARRFDADNGKYGWLRGNTPIMASDGSLVRGGFLSIDVWSARARTRAANSRFELNADLQRLGAVAFYDPMQHPLHVYFPAKEKTE